MKIDVTSNEREIFIKFNNITHFRCDRRELIGLQSWVVNRGRITPVYSIEIFTKSNCNIILEYDNINKWKKVLDGLNNVPFLNEFKIQDP